MSFEVRILKILWISKLAMVSLWKKAAWNNSNIFAEHKLWNFFLIHLFDSSFGFQILENISQKKNKLCISQIIHKNV